MFSGNNATITIKRHSYAGGKSTAPEVRGTYKGYLTPEDGDSQFLTPETMGDVYRFSTQYGADLKKADIIELQSDILEEDGKTFSVMGVIHKHGCSLSFTRAWLVLDTDGD